MIKIPKTFIDRLETDGPEAVIARAILKFAESLGIPTVAEGVETPAALAVLRELGCPAYQGYLFARPMAATAVTQMLTRANGAPAVVWANDAGWSDVSAVVQSAEPAATT